MIPWSLVHIPKTGGLSILTAIGYREQEHTRASETPRGHFLATFVRNPMSRFVSVFEFLRDPKWQQCAIPEDTNFREFVLSRAFLTADTKFFNPMTYWLDAPVGFIGRYENLHEDFDRLRQLIGLKRPAVLPQIHVREGPHWSTFYDDATAEVVWTHYADDITRFGYGAEIN